MVKIMKPEIKQRIEQIRQGEVPDGYMKTKVGVIPADWNICTINDIATVSSGSTPNRKKEEYWNGNIPWVTTGELESGYVKQTKEAITVKALIETNLKTYLPGTLLLAMYGQGKTRGTVARLCINATINQACAGIVVQSGNSDYVYFVLQKAYENIRKLSNSGSQDNLNADIIKSYTIAYPLLHEQNKIATILSTQDKVIELYEKKIEQLQLLKKICLKKMFPKEGSLVPEVRFPGFTAPWEQCKLGELFEFLQNNTLSRAELNNESGVAKNIHYGDILIKFGECIDISIAIIPFISSRSIADKFKNSFLKNGDIIMADTAEDETVGKCSEVFGIQNIPIISGLHTIPIRPRKEFALGYLGYYMNSVAYHDQLIPLMHGVKVTSISKGEIKNTNISYPKDKDEQARLGLFFLHIDHLITLHQRRLDEEKRKKKALMQLLLTGIVRV